MTLNRTTLIGIGLFVIVALFVYWYWSKNKTESSQAVPDEQPNALASYTFSQGQNNIAPPDLNTDRLLDTATPAELAIHCSNTPKCVGFNHLGFMMDNRHHHTVAAWQDQPNAGLYLQ